MTMYQSPAPPLSSLQGGSLPGSLSASLSGYNQDSSGLPYLNFHGHSAPPLYVPTTHASLPQYNHYQHSSNLWSPMTSQHQQQTSPGVDDVTDSLMPQHHQHPESRSPCLSGSSNPGSPDSQQSPSPTAGVTSYLQVPTSMTSSTTPPSSGVKMEYPMTPTSLDQQQPQLQHQQLAPPSSMNLPSFLHHGGSSVSSNGAPASNNTMSLPVSLSSSINSNGASPGGAPGFMGSPGALPTVCTESSAWGPAYSPSLGYSTPQAFPRPQGKQALLLPCKKETLIQCWVNVGPASKTMGHY